MALGARPFLAAKPSKSRDRAAGGGRSGHEISAAVGKHEEKRKPEVFSGYRKEGFDATKEKGRSGYGVFLGTFGNRGKRNGASSF